MPYIITTTPREPRGWEDDADFKPSRRAVGTLDEAREEIWKSISSDTLADVRPVGTMNDAVTAIGAAGGTVGPLPDGTVIEVEPAEWGDLVHAGRLDRDADDEQLIIDAYNAAQED